MTLCIFWVMGHAISKSIVFIILTQRTASNVVIVVYGGNEWPCIEKLVYMVRVCIFE